MKLTLLKTSELLYRSSMIYPAFLFWAIVLKYVSCFHLCLSLLFSVTKSCLTLCNPMNYSMPGFPILHYLLEYAQTFIFNITCFWIGKYDLLLGVSKEGIAPMFLRVWGHCLSRGHYWECIWFLSHLGWAPFSATMSSNSFALTLINPHLLEM